MKACCSKKNCLNPNCAHSGEHEFFDRHCSRKAPDMPCSDSRCAPVHSIFVTNEKPYETFPTGWPVRCPNCNSWNFTYISENTGNIRRYTCKKCNDMYLATWKGPRITSAMCEPKNTSMEDWDWARVVNRLPETGNTKQ